MLPCSYVEESNADKAIKALTSALAPRAKAIRNGEVTQIEAVDLVPGGSKAQAAILLLLAAHFPSMASTLWHSTCTTAARH